MAEPPAVSRGSAPVGARGQSPLEARAFSQSELPRKPPIDTFPDITLLTPKLHDDDDDFPVNM